MRATHDTAALARGAALALAFMAILTLSMSGCSTVDGGKVYEKDGKRYGATSGTFRHRWWNYYERADSYIEGGYYAEAEKDLLKAVEMRNEDGRRARTYGMHFMDYFPHRELGIAYLGQDRPDEALSELEISMSQEETAKAKFYLNKARQAILSKKQAQHPGPAISVSQAPPGLTNALVLTLSGVAKDEEYVSAVSVNGMAELIELASKEVNFSKTIMLDEGTNSVTVKATDLLGKTITAEYEVVADRRGPFINIISPSPGVLTPGASVEVRGTAFDNSGIAGLTVDGKAVDIHPGSDVPFSVSVSPSSQVIEITATDAAGNTTTAVLGESWYSKPEFGLGGPVSFGLYASTDGRVARAGGERGPGPRLKLKDLSENQEVYHDTLYIDGQVTDEADIVSLTLNGEELITNKGKNIFFNLLTPLHKGKNSFEFVASDASGVVTRNIVNVIKTPQIARSITSRLSISAIPFKTNSESFFAEPAYDSFLDSLTTQGRFKMVERALLEEVLAEQALSQEEIVDPSTAARLGKVIAAECVLVGKLYETEHSFEVYVRVVDTETAEILVSHDVYGEDKSLSGISRLMEGLAIKFKNSFPMVEGLVLKADGDKLVVDIGKNHGVQKNAIIVVFKEGEPLIHPVTGKNLGAPTKVIAKGKLYEIYDDMAMAEVVSTENGAVISAMDQVITK